jgi:RNA polymerase sigma-70 factor, ECF subfamily
MSLPPKDPTTELLARAQASDASALNQLVERFTPILLSIARRRLGAGGRINHDPDDLVQQAWLTFLEKLPDIRPSEGVATPIIMAFLSRALGYHYLNIIKSASVQRRETPTTSQSPGAFEALADTTSSIVAKVSRSERANAVHRAIEALPRIDQEILQLRGFDRLPFSSVAPSVNLTPAAAAKRYERALDKLRELLPDSILADLYDLDVESGRDAT